MYESVKRPNRNTSFAYFERSKGPCLLQCIYNAQRNTKQRDQNGL